MVEPRASSSDRPPRARLRNFPQAQRAFAQVSRVTVPCPATWCAEPNPLSSTPRTRLLRMDMADPRGASSYRRVGLGALLTVRAPTPTAREERHRQPRRTTGGRTGSMFRRTSIAASERGEPVRLSLRQGLTHSCLAGETRRDMLTKDGGGTACLSLHPPRRLD